MRIVYIGLSYFPCQIGKTDLEKVAEQAAKDHEVHILVKNKSHQPRYEKKHEFTIHRFFSFSENSLLDDIFYSLFLPVYCKIVLKKHMDTVFHIYNPFYCSFILQIFLRILFPTSKIIFDIRTGPLKEGIKKTLNYFLITLAHLTATHTIIISTHLLRHFFWVNRKRITEISLGYTPVKAQHLLQPITTNKKTFIYIGSIYPRRGIANMLAAFDQYFIYYPEDTIVLVGGGDDAYYQELQNKHTKHNFIYKGKVAHQEVATYLLSADYGVAYIPQSSYFMDQPPLKTIEYLGHGLPVLATNTNGNKLFVTSVNGILTDDSREATYQGALQLRAQFGDPSKQEISNSVAQYTRENIYLQINKIYT